VSSRRELNTEYPPAGEQPHIDSLIASLRTKMEGDYAKTRMLRDAHPKMHGCVHGVFAVLPGLEPDLTVGLFAENRSYPAWVRFSNQNNRVSPDSKPDIRGVAIKLMGVGGTKLIDSDPECTTHDFILISDNRFVTKDVAEFDGLVKGMLGGLVRLAWYFLTHPRVLRNLLTSLKKFANPLNIRYFSVVPYLLGVRAVKYSLIPRKVGDATVPAHAADDYLKQAMVDRLSSGEVVFDFAVQFQMDPYLMPIEDPGIAWNEADSPFLKVATLTIPAQVFDSAERAEFGDNLSFNPWRCLAEHRPLGGISRARRQVYQALSEFRHEHNGVAQAEPSADIGIPTASGAPEQ
jgi:hypothetical protein